MARNVIRFPASAANDNEWAPPPQYPEQRYIPRNLWNVIEGTKVRHV